MTEVTQKEYNYELSNFCKKHNLVSDCRVYTGALVDNYYTKIYTWEHGAQWFEHNELVTDFVDVNVHGISFRFPVHYWKVEYFSTDNPFFKRCYIV